MHYLYQKIHVFFPVTKQYSSLITDIVALVTATISLDLSHLLLNFIYSYWLSPDLENKVASIGFSPLVFFAFNDKHTWKKKSETINPFDTNVFS